MYSLTNFVFIFHLIKVDKSSFYSCAGQILWEREHVYIRCTCKFILKQNENVLANYILNLSYTFTVLKFRIHIHCIAISQLKKSFKGITYWDWKRQHIIELLIKGKTSLFECTGTSLKMLTTFIKKIYTMYIHRKIHVLKSDTENLKNIAHFAIIHKCIW